MPSRRVYWDACCFLSYLEGDEDRLPILTALFESAQRGEIRIMTSVVSLTEVAYRSSEKDAHQLDNNVEEQIDALFADPAVTLIEYHEGIARRARQLIREAKFSVNEERALKPMDAIHLASALSIGVDAVHTYDDKWTGYAEMLGILIGPPEGVTLGLGLPD